MFPNELYKLHVVHSVLVGTIIEVPFQLFVFASLPTSILEALNYSYRPYLFFSNGIKNFGKLIVICLAATIILFIYLFICIFITLLISKLAFAFLGFLFGLVFAIFFLYLIKCIYEVYLRELLISNLPFKDNLRIACNINIKSIISFFVLLLLFGIIDIVIISCTILIHNPYLSQIIYCFIQAVLTVILLVSLMNEFDVAL